MNTKFIHPSTFYFLFFAALSAWSPYIVLYYQQLGLNGSQIGLLLGIGPLVSLVGAPIWTGLADSRQMHKIILMATIMLAIVAMAILPFLKDYAFLLLGISIFWFAIAPMIALVDNATITMLGDRRENYGKIRIWGTVGWGLMAPLAGIYLQKSGLIWMFGIYCLLMLLTFIPAMNLSFSSNPGHTALGAELRKMITEKKWVMFLGVVFAAGIGLSAHQNYLAVLVEDVGGNRSLMGIAMFLSTLSEFPVMFFSNLILQKLHSRGLLILAVGFTGLRCLMYGLAGGPALLLIIQLLQGLTFPALWIAGVTYVAENAPQGLGATVQAIFGGALMGFGMATGGLLGGVLIDMVGLRWMYGIFGLIVLCGLGLYLANDRKLPPIPV